MLTTLFAAKNKILLGGIVLLIAGCAVLTVGHFFVAKSVDTALQGGAPKIQPRDMQIEIAATKETQEKGLGGRTELPKNYSMLFVFGAPENRAFWMKDMLISIDIVWLREDGVILGIEHSVSPKTYPKLFYSPGLVSYVLETNAGFARESGWSVGEKLELPRN